MARRKAAKSKRDRVAETAPVAKARKPRRPAPPVRSKARTPATTRGGVKAGKGRKIGVRRLSQLPPPQRHEPLSAILWERGRCLAATRHAMPPPKPVPRVMAPLIAPMNPPVPSDRKLAAQFAMIARRLRRAAAAETRWLRDIEWKEKLDRAALGAAQRELTRSINAGIATEKKAARIAADEAEHKAKYAPTRPVSFGRYASMNFDL